MKLSDYDTDSQTAMKKYFASKFNVDEADVDEAYIEARKDDWTQMVVTSQEKSPKNKSIKTTILK